MFVLYLAAIAFLLFLIEWLKSVTTKGPPGPFGLPIIGYTLFMGSDPIKTIQELSSKYGKIMRINLLGNDYIFLNDFETVQEAFVKQSENFSGRPNNQFTAYSFFFGPKNVLSSENESWKIQHKYMLSKLSNLGLGKSVFEVTINNVCDVLIERIRSKNGDSFDVYPYLANFTSNIASELLLGISNEIDDPRYTVLRKNAYYFFYSFPDMDAFFSGPVFHLKKRLELKRYNNLMKAKCLYDEYFRSLLNERMSSDETAENRDDLLGHYVNALKSEKVKHLDVETIISNLTLLFVDPPETASLFLYHCINMMAHYPNIQETVQKEIDDVIGNDRIVSYEHKSRMDYTNAVFTEIERYACIVPLSYTRLNHCETTVGGYKIPKRSLVLSNQWKLSRDKRYFSNPDQFDPRNFLNGNGNFIKMDAHTPFSVGKRKCLGSKLAEVEIFIAFTTLMQKFIWKISDSKFTERQIQEGFIRVLKPFQVSAIPR